MAVPLISASFIQMAYSMTDMLWLGHLGSDAVAAAGAAGFFTWLCNSQSKQIPFTLNIRKYEKIDGVLELMQKTGRVHFDIKGDTIIVK